MMGVKPFLVSFISLVTFLGSFALAESTPACVADVNSCEAYLCRDQKQRCGEDGYWQGYGHHFCKKFLDDHEKFSAPLQSWLSDVRYCLQVEALNLNPQLSCDETHKAAIDSHVACYVETGFCNLNYSDQATVYWYLRSAAKDILTWIEAARLVKACNENNN